MSHTQDGFLNELSKMFKETKNKGSVQISMKRFVAPTEEEIKEKKRIEANAVVKQAEANAKIAKEKKESAKGKKEGKEAAASTPSPATSSKGNKAGSAKGEAKAAAGSKKKSSKKASNKPLKPKKIRTPPSDDAEYVTLIHAKISNGTKVSTLVPLKNLAKFHMQLTTVLKANAGEGLLAKGQTPKPSTAKGKNAVGGAKSIAAAKARKLAKKAAQKAKKRARLDGQSDASGATTTPATSSSSSTPPAATPATETPAPATSSSAKGSKKETAAPPAAAASTPTPAPAKAAKKGKGK